MSAITRTIWILSIVSLFTDIASEMLYPIMPLFLKSIGFSVVLIGILEGIAEATAGLSKGYFGKLSDQTNRRMPFVQWGYALSAISKPMLALFTVPVWVFFSRTLDRFGKGVRTGARDAVLSDEAVAGSRGKVFGFHRAMDSLGAVIGPLLALLYLKFYPQQYRNLFFIALAPGLLAVLFSLLLRDKSSRQSRSHKVTSFFSFLSYWKQSPAIYRKLVAALLLFALFNSSDVFLLLKAKESGLNDGQVITLYIFYNLIYAIFSYPLGAIGDRIGLKKVLITGLLLFSIVYAGIAFASSYYTLYLLFFLYGIYVAGTEGISKAWISNISQKNETATAIGTYAAFQSICIMLASAFAGLLWYRFGASAAFICAAIVAAAVAIYLAVDRSVKG